MDAIDNTYKRNNGCHNCLFDSLHTIIECTKAIAMWLMWASMERPQFLALRHETSSTLCGNSKSLSNYRPPVYEQWWRQHFHYVLKMSFHRASTTFRLASWKMHVLYGDVTPWSHYRPPFWAETLVTISLLYPKYVRQRRVNDLWPCIMDNPRAVGLHEVIMTLSAAFLGNNSCDYITTMS
jgi:hypothetical protein